MLLVLQFGELLVKFCNSDFWVLLFFFFFLFLIIFFLVLCLLLLCGLSSQQCGFSLQFLVM